MTKWSATRWATMGGGKDAGAKAQTISQAVLRKLIEGGGDPNAFDGAGQAALHTVTFLGREDLVQLLLDQGADPNLGGVTTAAVASTASKVDGDDGSLTALAPLHWAAIKNHTGIARLLVNGGGDVDVMNKDGMTALGIAADKQHSSVCKELLELGADANHPLVRLRINKLGVIWMPSR